MTTKTITVTVDAYESLKSLKEPRESFSETIKRIAGKRPLSDFFGILSEESGEKIEKTINKLKREHSADYKRKMKRIVAELNGGQNGRA